MHFQVKASRIWVFKKVLYRFQQLVHRKFGVSSVNKEKWCFSHSKLWCNVINGEYLVKTLVPVVWVILT